MQQTPWVDFEETVYRYRFQGTIFAEREGYLSSSDVGASFHYNLPGNYGDVQAASTTARTTPGPRSTTRRRSWCAARSGRCACTRCFRGLRLTGFYDDDSYVKNGERRRGIVAVTFEHRLRQRGVQLPGDRPTRPRVSLAKVEGRGWSVWATPKTPTTSAGKGCCGSTTSSRTRRSTRRRNRTIVGVAYWFPHQGTVSTALLFDFENVDNNDFAPARPDERRFAVHALVNF